MGRVGQHLSYANVAATLALVFAMSGGAIAATGGFAAASSAIKACVGSDGVLKVQKGKRCKRGQRAVSWNQHGPAGAKGATGATGPSGLAGLNGAPVPSAATAQTANNALALGGIPASGFTRSDCASTTGQIKGFALVQAEQPQTGPMFTPVSPSYNCSGAEVGVDQVEPETGIYLVRFAGNPAEIATATGIGRPGNIPVTVSVELVQPGEWFVYTAAGSTIRPEPFELLVP